MHSSTANARSFCVSTLTLILVTLPTIVLGQSGTADDDLYLIASAGLGGVNAVDMSRDGRLMLTGSDDGTVRLWDVDSGREVRRFEGHFSEVTSVELSPNGQTILSAALDGLAATWDTSTGALLEVFMVDARGVWDVAFSPDGDYFVTGSSDGTARLWNADSGEEIRQFEGHSAYGITSIAYSPDGQTILTGSYDGTARLWEVATGAELLRLGSTFAEGNREGVSAVTFSPDGRFVVVGNNKGGVVVWDVAEGEEVRRVQAHSRYIHSVSFSPDGQTLLAGSWDYSLSLWHFESGREVGRVTGHTDQVNGTMFSPDGASILSGSDDATARLWDAESGAEIRVFEGLTSPITNASRSSDGLSLVTMSADGTVRLWDLAAANGVRRLDSDLIEQATAVAQSPDGRTVAVGGEFGAVTVVSANTGESLLELKGHSDAVVSLVFSSDGHRLLTGSWDGTARIWDVASGVEVRRFETEDGFNLATVALAPDEQTVILADEGDTVRLWSAVSGELIREFEGIEFELASVAYSPDGRAMLTGGYDGVARLWDLATGDQIRSFEGHLYHLTSVAFSPDGRSVLTGSEDGTAVLWDIATGAERQSLVGHASRVWYADFLFDGRVIVSVGVDSSVRLWDPSTGEELLQMYGFAASDWAVLDPDGRFDASGGGEIDGLHWVLGDEPIQLRQLKDRFYEPGLMGKILGLNEEPLRDIDASSEIALYPETVLRAPIDETGILDLTLVNRGGGIGRVIVSINGKEIASDARGVGFDATAAEASVSISIGDHPYLVPGEENTIEVSAYNAEGYLVSRGLQATWIPPGAAEPPELWAVVVGVSDYSGTAIDLNFASRDATAFADALEGGAERLFGAENVHLTVLTSNSEHLPPTRENIIEALRALSNARSSDIVLVYLAGHGVAAAGQDGDYYFLTQSATNTAMNDPAVRSAVAISSEELTELLLEVPVANKQVLILDTCGAGRVVEQLTAARGVPSSQVRAIDRMQDRAGLFVLAGSAADAVSYEASEYGQGILTYSLLEGMRGASLRDDEYLDVSQWFGYAADRVQVIADDIGGIQRPLVGMPRGTGSFDVARLTEEERSLISLQEPRPFLIRSNFQLHSPPIDPVNLTSLVNDRLREISAEDENPPWVYVDTAAFEDGYQMTGRYAVDSDTNVVEVELYLIRENEVVGSELVSGSIDDLETLIDDIRRVAELALWDRPTVH